MSDFKIPSAKILNKELKEGKFRNVYFICGEDSHEITAILAKIESAYEPFITSEFDKEKISAEKGESLAPILDMAAAFPFGSEKKLIILKNFELLNDKKLLKEYLSSPPEFTILVIAHYGKIKSFKIEPFAALTKHSNYFFEVEKLNAAGLSSWLVQEAESLGSKLSSENAHSIIDYVGDDKSLLLMHLHKYINYLKDEKEITIEAIENLSSRTKEHTIFHLQNELAKGNKAGALDISFKLIDGGGDIVFIIIMLTKYFSTILQSLEHSRNNISDNEAAKRLEVSFYYYKNCKNAKYFLNEHKLFNALRALLKADLTTKTSSAEDKTTAANLIAEIFQV
jgi:DNA polymerase III delta subunit